MLDKRIRARLFDLRNQDLRLSTYCFGLPNKAIREAIRDSHELLDRIEIVWPEREKSDLQSGLRSLRDEVRLPILISPLWSGHGKTDSQGRHLHVITHGFADADHVTSGSFFDDEVPLGGIDGVVFRLDVKRGFLKAAAAIAKRAKEYGIEAHVIASLTGANPAEWQNDDRVAATGAIIAQLAAIAAPDVRIFLDTFGDVDRGYYRRAGLIDKQCNPKIGWHAMRALRFEIHTALDARVASAPIELGEWSLVPVNRDGTVEYVACHFGPGASAPHRLDIQSVARKYEVFDLGIGRTATIIVNAGDLPETLSNISSTSKGSVVGPYYVRPIAG